jgi:hypothetical protein
MRVLVLLQNKLPEEVIAKDKRDLESFLTVAIAP